VKFYIIGLTVSEAQGHAMRMKKEHQGHSVRIMSVDSALHGALRGLHGSDIEITVLPRAWEHRRAMAFGLEIGHLEEAGVRVITPTQNQGEQLD
jgi:hypothetical protein